jgi:hypothetical protein
MTEMIFLPLAVYTAMALNQPFEMPRYYQQETVDCRIALMAGAYRPCADPLMNNVGGSATMFQSLTYDGDYGRDRDYR